jgi:hypothetical protein
VVCANRISDQATRLSDEVLPARVYHYTSTDGLLGILDSGHLWATDLRYLNDTSELHFGRSLTRFSGHDLCCDHAAGTAVV